MEKGMRKKLSIYRDGGMVAPMKMVMVVGDGKHGIGVYHILQFLHVFVCFCISEDP